jgi:hypothetical protein
MVTIYHQLGLDPETTFTSWAGRPATIGSNGQVISELIA